MADNNWLPLRIGAGGYVTGIDIAADDTMVVHDLVVPKRSASGGGSYRRPRSLCAARACVIALAKDAPPFTH